MRFKASRVSSLWKERRQLVKSYSIVLTFFVSSFIHLSYRVFFYLITEPLSDYLNVFVGAKVLKTVTTRDFVYGTSIILYKCGGI